ncbi:MAG: J domain-containing protein, partial [Sphingomonadaceae bacterium]
MAALNHLYRVLGVSPTASQAEIEAAYRTLMKRFHPDLHPRDAGRAGARSAEINDAYRVLGNRERRARYDAAQRAAQNAALAVERAAPRRKSMRRQRA